MHSSYIYICIVVCRDTIFQAIRGAQWITLFDQNDNARGHKFISYMPEHNATPPSVQSMYGRGIQRPGVTLT